MVYEQWRELHSRGEQGDTWETSKILNDIRDYNIDDCDSTQELVDWLRQQQAEHSIVYLGKTEVTEPDVKEEVTERTQLRDRLLEQVLSELESDPRKAALTEMYKSRLDLTVFRKRLDLILHIQIAVL